MRTTRIMKLNNCKSDLTFRLKARYAFTLQAELEKSIDLVKDEKILKQTTVRLYNKFLAARTCYFTITNKRIILLKHYAFKPDTIISIAFKDIKSIEERRTKTLNFLFPLRRFKYLCIQYCDNDSFGIYGYSGHLSKYWKPSDSMTNSLLRKIKEQQ